MFSVPAPFIHATSALLPALSSYPPAHQSAVVGLLFASPFLSHSSDQPGEFPVHEPWLREHFRSVDRFHALNQDLDLFTRVSKAGVGTAAAWRRTDRADELFDIVCRQLSDGPAKNIARLSKAVDKRFKATRHQWPRRVIQSRSKSGSNTVWTGDSIDMLRVPVALDATALSAFQDACSAFRFRYVPPAGFEWLVEEYKQIEKRYSRRRAIERSELARKQAAALAAEGWQSPWSGCTVPQSYQEVESGRLYAGDVVNLQSCCKEVRKAALRGCWDLDLEAAHHSLLSQLATPANIETPWLVNYAADRKTIRIAIAHRVGVPVDDVKIGLTAIVYGCRLSNDPGCPISGREPSTLSQIFGNKAAAFLADPDVQALAKDMKACRKKVVDHYKRESRKPGFLVNAMGKAMKVTEFKITKNAPQGEWLPVAPKRLLAHLLQGAEALVLRSVVDVLAPQIVCLQHDGLTVSGSIYDLEGPDVQALAAHVKRATGFDVKFESEHLMMVKKQQLPQLMM